MPRNREKQQFVKASGTMQEIIQAIAHEVYSLGGDDDDLRQILDEDGVVRQAAAKQIMELAVPRHSWERATYQVELSGQSSGILVAAGLYFRVDDLVRSRSAVKSPESGKRLLGLVRFERTPTVNQVYRACARTNLHVAGRWELEAFGANYRRSPAPTQHIIALYRHWHWPAGVDDQTICVPCISSVWEADSQNMQRELRYVTLEQIAQFPSASCYYLAVQ